VGGGRRRAVCRGSGGDNGTSTARWRCRSAAGAARSGSSGGGEHTLAVRVRGRRGLEAQPSSAYDVRLLVALEGVHEVVHVVNGLSSAGGLRLPPEGDDRVGLTVREAGRAWDGER
jgi:hypothetical protein